MKFHEILQQGRASDCCCNCDNWLYLQHRSVLFEIDASNGVQKFHHIILDIILASIPHGTNSQKHSLLSGTHIIVL